MASFLALGMAAAQFGASVYQGAQKWKSAKQNYKSLRENAEIVRQETKREAANIRREADMFAKQQMMDFISSGVTGEGTPTVLTKDTYKLGEEEAKATERAGEFEALQLDRQAKQTKSQGKAAIISSIFGGGSSAMGAASAIKGK